MIRETPAARDGHHVLAHPVAERRAHRHLPVARGADLGAARQQHRRLPHAAALQQLHGLGRRVPGEPHRSRAQRRRPGQGRGRWSGPIRSRIEWPVRWLEDALPVRAVPRTDVRRELGLAPDALLGVGVDRLDYTKGIEERLLRGGAPARALPRVPRPLHVRCSSRRRAARRSSATGSSTSAWRRSPTRSTTASATALPADHPAARPPRAADGVPLLPGRRRLLREQPARRHEPGRQGVRRRARRRAGRAGAQRVHGRGARADRGADRQPVRSRARPATRWRWRCACRPTSSASACGRCAGWSPSSTSTAGRAGCWSMPRELRRKERMTGRLSSPVDAAGRRILMKSTCCARQHGAARPAGLVERPARVRLRRHAGAHRRQSPSGGDAGDAPRGCSRRLRALSVRRHLRPRQADVARG